MITSKKAKNATDISISGMASAVPRAAASVKILGFQKCPLSLNVFLR